MKTSIPNAASAHQVTRDENGVSLCSLEKWDYLQDETVHIDTECGNIAEQQQHLSIFLNDKHSAKSLWYKESFELLFEWLHDQDAAGSQSPILALEMRTLRVGRRARFAIS